MPVYKYGAISNTGGIKLIEKIRDAGAIGLVIACKNMADSGLLVAANAEQKGKGPEYYQVPLPIPTVLVAGNDEGLLAGAAASGGRNTGRITVENWMEIVDASSKLVTYMNVDGYYLPNTERVGFETRRHNDVPFMIVVNTNDEPYPITTVRDVFP